MLLRQQSHALLCCLDHVLLATGNPMRGGQGKGSEQSRTRWCCSPVGNVVLIVCCVMQMTGHAMHGQKRALEISLGPRQCQRACHMLTYVHSCETSSRGEDSGIIGGLVYKFTACVVSLSTTLMYRFSHAHCFNLPLSSLAQVACLPPPRRKGWRSFFRLFMERSMEPPRLGRLP